MFKAKRTMKKLFCRQPKLLIVIELKLAEILGVCGIVGILYGIDLFLTPTVFPMTKEWYWLITKGIGYLATGVVGFSIGYGMSFIIHQLIVANWAWAERLKKK